MSDQNWKRRLYLGTDRAAPSPALTREALIAARPAIAKAIVEHYRIYDFHEVWREKGAAHLLEFGIEPAILAFLSGTPPPAPTPHVTTTERHSLSYRYPAETSPPTEEERA